MSEKISLDSSDSSLFFNLDLSAGVNRLVDDARFRAGSCVFVYFNQD